MMIRQHGETLPSKCLPSSDPNKPACQSSWGLGFDVNLTKYFEHAPDGQPTGAFFGHSGFNSGYLTIMFGSKTGGTGNCSRPHSGRSWNWAGVGVAEKV